MHFELAVLTLGERVTEMAEECGPGLSPAEGQDWPPELRFSKMRETNDPRESGLGIPSFAIVDACCGIGLEDADAVLPATGVWPLGCMETLADGACGQQSWRLEFSHLQLVPRE